MTVITLCFLFIVLFQQIIFLIELIVGLPNEVPLTWYNVSKGETVRFRVIAVGSIYPLRISVDQHYLTVISSDGYDVNDTVVESFIVNPGERFDFLLTANQTIGNYWIRANSLEVGTQVHFSNYITWQL